MSHVFFFMVWGSEKSNPAWKTWFPCFLSDYQHGRVFFYIAISVWCVAAARPIFWRWRIPAWKYKVADLSPPKRNRTTAGTYGSKYGFQAIWLRFWAKSTTLNQMKFWRELPKISPRFSLFIHTLTRLCLRPGNPNPLSRTHSSNRGPRHLAAILLDYVLLGFLKGNWKGKNPTYQKTSH